MQWPRSAAHLQESLVGTQAEADALMEEAADALVRGTDDAAEGALMLHISMATLQEAGNAAGVPYTSWVSLITLSIPGMQISLAEAPFAAQLSRTRQSQ